MKIDDSDRVDMARYFDGDWGPIEMQCALSLDGHPDRLMSQSGLIVNYLLDNPDSEEAEVILRELADTLEIHIKGFDDSDSEIWFYSDRLVELIFVAEKILENPGIILPENLDLAGLVQTLKSFRHPSDDFSDSVGVRSLDFGELVPIRPRPFRFAGIKTLVMGVRHLFPQIVSKFDILKTADLVQGGEDIDGASLALLEKWKRTMVSLSGFFHPLHEKEQISSIDVGTDDQEMRDWATLYSEMILTDWFKAIPPRSGVIVTRGSGDDTETETYLF